MERDADGRHLTPIGVLGQCAVVDAAGTHRAPSCLQLSHAAGHAAGRHQPPIALRHQSAPEGAAGIDHAPNQLLVLRADPERSCAAAGDSHSALQPNRGHHAFLEVPNGASQLQQPSGQPAYRKPP